MHNDFSKSQNTLLTVLLLILLTTRYQIVLFLMPRNDKVLNLLNNKKVNWEMIKKPKSYALHLTSQCWEITN